MERLRVIRFEETEQGALGVLTFDGKFFLFSLEPDSQDKKRPHVEDGTYPLRRFSGAKWKDTLEIVVPGHSAVLFHVGNFEEDSRMCVLLGSAPGYLAHGGKKVRAVLSSWLAYRKFQKEVVSSITDGDEVTFISSFRGCEDEENV